MSRQYLSSQPRPVSQQIAQPARFKAPQQTPPGRVEFFVNEEGRADVPRPAQERVIDTERHIHVVYNANTRSGGEATGLVTVTVTDRTNNDDFRSPRTGDSKKGHVEETIFLRPQSPQRIEAEVHRAVEALRARSRGAE